jgi:ubiquinone/menaquinone biosynthesis C-methylase UbiE
MVNALKETARSLRLEFGWHYLLDQTWILSHLDDPRDCLILDAGAGTGVLQWHLAKQGARVISVDRTSRANLPLRFRTRFQVRGMRRSDLVSWDKVLKESLLGSNNWRVKMSTQAQNVLGLAAMRPGRGQVIVYNQDLADLRDIPDSSVDAVVSVSALEHNQPEALESVVAELMRVLKAGGVLLASLNASPEQDWWHEASSGWCYSEATLRRIFQIAPEIPSNYDRYPELFQALKNCSELRQDLAGFYYHSGNNGMPWGKWDPQYVPVGICKVKRQNM